MTRPDDVPEDVLISARAVAADWYRDLSPETVRRMEGGECDSWPIVRVAIGAVLAERERCAEEANAIDPAILEGKSERFVSIYCAARVDAATAIRKGS